MKVWIVHFSCPLHRSLTILSLSDLKKNKIIPIHYPVIYLTYKNDSCLNYFNFEMLKRILRLLNKRNSLMKQRIESHSTGAFLRLRLVPTHAGWPSSLAPCRPSTSCMCQAAWLESFFSDSDPWHLGPWLPSYISYTCQCIVIMSYTLIQIFWELWEILDQSNF